MIALAAAVMPATALASDVNAWAKDEEEPSAWRLAVDASVGAGPVVELGNYSWSALDVAVGLRVGDTQRPIAGVLQLRSSLPLPGPGGWLGGPDLVASLGLRARLGELFFAKALLGFGASLATVDRDMVGFFFGPSATLELGAELGSGTVRPAVLARLHGHWLLIGAALIAPTVAVGFAW